MDGRETTTYRGSVAFHSRRRDTDGGVVRPVPAFAVGATDEGERRDGGRAERIGGVLGWDVTGFYRRSRRAVAVKLARSDAMTDIRVVGMGRGSRRTRAPLRACELGSSSSVGLLVVSMASDSFVEAACVIVAYGRVPTPSEAASSPEGTDAEPTNGVRRSAID